jgi:hypothetical protein
MESKNFILVKSGSGLIQLRMRDGRGFITLLDQAELDELFKFLGPIQEGQEVVWLTYYEGRWHECAENDSGATLFVGPPT